MTVPTTTSPASCRDCAADDCGQCARPGGARLAADDQTYPVCCCGRRFTSATPVAAREAVSA